MSISTVTSEALQLKLRQLLPSQQGFGTDLSASDTIIPIIDLTDAAEGSDVGVNLQTALAYGNQTAFDVSSTTTTIANTAGFYRIVGGVTISSDTSTVSSGEIIISDTVTPKTVWKAGIKNGTGTAGILYASYNIDVIIYLRVGDICRIKSSATTCTFAGSIRQIADNNGTLVQPSGFDPQ